MRAEQSYSPSKLLPYDIIRIIADMAKFYKFSHINRDMREKYNGIFYEKYILNLNNLKQDCYDYNTMSYEIPSINNLHGINPLAIKNIHSIDELQLIIENTEIQEIKFHSFFNQSLKNIFFPKSLTHLTLNRSFSHPLEEIHLPDSLTHLTIDFDRPLSCADRLESKDSLPIIGLKLPSSLKYLTFGYIFNKSINKVQFPNKLKFITFGNKFNQSINRVQFPESVTKITFSRVYKRHINDKIREKIKIKTKN